MYARVALNSATAVEGLAWYYNSLNQINRDYLAMSHTGRRDNALCLLRLAQAELRRTPISGTT